VDRIGPIRERVREMDGVDMGATQLSMLSDLSYLLSELDQMQIDLSGANKVATRVVGEVNLVINENSLLRYHVIKLKQGLDWYADDCTCLSDVCEKPNGHIRGGIAREALAVLSVKVEPKG